MKKLEKIKTDFIELSLPIGLMIVAATENLDILFVNAMFAKMLGYENIDEFSKKSAMSAWDFVYKDDIENLRKLAADRIGKSDPYEIAYRVVKKDGAIVWVNQNSSHTYDENKNEIIFAYYT
ncbi:MAG: PAS domain-containing protein, partial [Clostridia bacterium]